MPINDLNVYARRGFSFSHECGFGQRPALLVVDFVNGFTDPAHYGDGNRALGTHEANLFDMQPKYADVMPCAAIARHFVGQRAAR